MHSKRRTFSRARGGVAAALGIWSLMAVTWLSQPNSARSTIGRRRRLASGPASQEAAPSPKPLELRPVHPATPYHPRLRRRSVGHRVASVDVVSLDESAGRRRSYALFSPYVPLPAIGGDASEKGVPATEASEVMNGSESPKDKPRFLRERTYSVIEPVFVRGPTHQWALPVKPNNGAWSRQSQPSEQAEGGGGGRPRSPHLPTLVATAANRRLSTATSTLEMLDDVRLPHDLDLDDEIFPEDPDAPEIVRKRSDTIALPQPLRVAPPTTTDLTDELPAPDTKEQRSSKLVAEVTDSLKHLWTRL